MLWEVKRLKYIRDYAVAFTFRDETVKEIDLEPFLYGRIFEPLREPERFKKLKVSGGSIAWRNGAGIAPETLYYDLGPVRSEEAAKNTVSRA